MTARVDFGGYVPGAIGRIAELHGTHYAQSHGFGLYFEAKVARDLAEFLLRFDPARDFFRTVLADGQVVGSIAINGGRSGRAAHLRWFILAPEARGGGVGRRLLSEAVEFCRTRGFESVYLWTLAGLEPAGRLYREAGFSLAEEKLGTQWGKEIAEERLEMKFALA